MTACEALQTVGFEDNSLRVMARIVGHAGVPATEISLTAITYGVYDMHDGSVVVAAGTVVTVADAIYDTLQVTADDPRWTLDTTGYNFAYTLAGTSFPSGRKRYQIEFNFDPASGDDYNFVVKHETLELFSK